MKNGYFTGQADRKGEWGGSPPGPDHKNVKILIIFFIEVLFFGTQNTFYLIVNGLISAVSCPFRCCQNEAGLLQMIIRWDPMTELGILVDG